MNLEFTCNVIPAQDDGGSSRQPHLQVLLPMGDDQIRIMTERLPAEGQHEHRRTDNKRQEFSHQ
jgi:hypothetical protein